MKIKCDVCDKEEASVLCTSDEAALCNGCDNVVHLANKLACKHLRFPLLNTSPNDSPVCDICKERRAFLFCREDRALFCSECDTCIHEANIHTQNHSRFLLTGIQLSSVSKSSSLLPTISNFSTSSCPTDQSSSEMSVENCINTTHNSTSTLQMTTSDSSNNWHPYCISNDDHQINYHHLQAAAGSSSSMTSINMASQYPMETLPAGWRFEDFLDPSCFTNESLF